jgi:hypothetical protein
MPEIVKIGRTTRTAEIRARELSRMRNHDEKIKDVSRSVLPSTGRKGARDTRRLIHKSASALASLPD